MSAMRAAITLWHCPMLPRVPLLGLVGPLLSRKAPPAIPSYISPSSASPPTACAAAGCAFCTASATSPPPDDATPLARQLSARIRATGAMTVAEYMREVLVHPLQGYYTRQTSVGEAADFVTAPEIAGMYGEMLGVWLVNEWQKLGSPQPLQLVELGPGRGTLMADMLKVMNQLAGGAQFSVHLVEVSRALAETQARTLGVQMTSSPDDQSETGGQDTSQQSGLSDSDARLTSPPDDKSETSARPRVLSSQPSGAIPRASSPDSQLDAEGRSSSTPGDQSEPDGAGTCDLLRGTSRCGRDVFWHARLQDVPSAFSLVVANEFFDAMPVHQFRRTEDGWREVLVDVTEHDPNRFRFVLARGRTPACFFIDEEEVAGRDELEVCPAAGAAVSLLAARLAEDGGAALICDYGHAGDRGDTLRAFRKHKCVDPLQAPGGADVTCDVDFARLARSAGPDVLAFGPVTQRRFLAEMGLAARLERLLASAGPERANRLRAAYSMLTDDMGERFKMLALLPATAAPILARWPPAGFAGSAQVS